MNRIAMLLLICLLITSCDDNISLEKFRPISEHKTYDEALFYEEELDLSAPFVTPPPPHVEEVAENAREETLKKGNRIIKSGNMKFEVHNLRKSKNKVDSILNDFSGFYKNEEYYSYENRITYSLQLKIPNEKFDSLIAEIEKGTGKMTSKNISAEDVTEEFVDLNIRLDNNLAYLKKYKDILEKAKSVKEILQIQDKIRRIEEEIESKKGKLKYLNVNVKYSTLDLEITELITHKISNKPYIGHRLVNAFNNGIQAFLSFLIGMMNCWPFLILGIVTFSWRKRILNKIRKIA